MKLIERASHSADGPNMAEHAMSRARDFACGSWRVDATPLICGREQRESPLLTDAVEKGVVMPVER
jgi:hypothetical protein